MAKIRNIKDKNLKKEIKKKAVATKAAKKSKRENRTINVHFHVHIHIHVHARKKKKVTRKGDKQRVFFNKGQRAYLNRMYGLINSLRKETSMFIEFLKKIQNDEVSNIQSESEFMKFYKHLPKRKDIKYNVIIAKVGSQLNVIRTFKMYTTFKQNRGKLVSFYPVNNVDLKNFLTKKNA